MEVGGCGGIVRFAFGAFDKTRTSVYSKSLLSFDKLEWRKASLWLQRSSFRNSPKWSSEFGFIGLV